MGYIHDFEQKLKTLLAEVDEETQKTVITLAKETALESFRNGITAAKAGGVRKEAERHTRALARGKDKIKE